MKADILDSYFNLRNYDGDAAESKWTQKHTRCQGESDMSERAEVEAVRETWLQAVLPRMVLL